MKRKAIFFFAAIVTGSAAFAQDTTGSTRPQIVIPLGKKPSKKATGNYTPETTVPYNQNTVQPLPGMQKSKPKKAKAAKPKKVWADTTTNPFRKKSM